MLYYQQTREPTLSDKPNSEQIDDQLNKAHDFTDEGRNPYPGMTYVEGVRDALQWVQGQGDEPIEEEA